MSNIQRFEPFRELERISNEISQQANSFFNRDALTTFFNTDFLGGTALSDVAKRFTMGNVIENPIQPGFAPRVDVAEDADHVFLHIELPGMEKQDVSVAVSNDNVLVIKGEHKNEFKEEGKNFVRLERGYGAFERSFTLPANVQTEAINAQFDNGVLNITLPKAEASKPKHIAIEVK
jgi:HSP20 family protein